MPPTTNNSPFNFQALERAIDALTRATIGAQGTLKALVNSGTAGGTMFYMQLGPIKILWITTGQLASSAAGPGYTFVFPPGFFTTVNSVFATESNATVTNYQVISVAGVPTIAGCSASIYSPSGAATGAINLLVIGT